MDECELDSRRLEEGRRDGWSFREGDVRELSSWNSALRRRRRRQRVAMDLCRMAAALM